MIIRGARTGAAGTSGRRPSACRSRACGTRTCSSQLRVLIYVCLYAEAVLVVLVPLVMLFYDCVFIVVVCVMCVWLIIVAEAVLVVLVPI